jgi:hypothetical protein
MGIATIWGNDEQNLGVQVQHAMESREDPVSTGGHE